MYRTNSRMTYGILCAASFAVIGATTSYHRGQDCNWDQNNYHLYIAWALIHGRMQHDIAAAGVQTFFNPLPFVPFYEMARHLPPVVTGLLTGAIGGLALLPVLLLCDRVAPGPPSARRRILLVSGLAVSAASPLAVSEIGTSFIDLMLTLPILLATWLMLSQSRRQLGASALILGAVAGLKLTDASFCTGFIVAACFGWQGWKERSTAVALAATSGLVGFVSTGGYWCWRLWSSYENPFFPYYNNYFRSPDFPPWVAFDVNFRPRSLASGLSYPFRWVVGQASSSELPFRDVRFALLIGLGLLILVALLRQRRSHTDVPHGPVHLRLIVFFAVSFLVWLFQFGIQRYAIPLELLTGPVLLSLLAQLRRQAVENPITICFAVLSLLTMRTCDWGHTSWSHSWSGLESITNFDTAAVVLIGKPPLTFATRAFPSDTVFVGAQTDLPLAPLAGTQFSRRMAQAIHSGKRLFLLTRGDIDQPLLSLLGAYHLAIGANCRIVTTQIELLKVCDVLRLQTD